jgi:flavin-dependent dehydrogenase
MKAVTIVGGGLAGLSLGIGLRRRQVPVTIFEAGHYPRHRVCGEFISGGGRAVLGELGLEEKLLKAGAREAQDAAFFGRRWKGAAQPLPQPALCVSRFVLDRFLAEEFRELGGELREGRRWREAFGEGIVRSTGHRSQSVAGGWRWFGLKVHARGVLMAADLEMYLLTHGYVGLCRLGGGEVNVCGLFRRRAANPEVARNWRLWLRGPEGSALSERLAAADFLEDSFCAVAGLSLAPERAAPGAECRIGDAITMIAPLTGNGMSMAFESAAVAMGPVEAYSRGEMAWEEASREIAARCQTLFGRRLRWGSWLQGALLRGGASDALIWLGGRWPWLWEMFFQRTR